MSFNSSNFFLNIFLKAIEDNGVELNLFVQIYLLAMRIIKLIIESGFSFMFPNIIVAISKGIVILN